MAAGDSGMSLVRWMIPWSFIVLRMFLGLLVFFGAKYRWSGIEMAGVVLIALLSDIFDGILARRWGNETSTLRVSDSIADTIFYLGVAGALWIEMPDILQTNKYWFITLFALEGFRYVFDFLKYRKTASYHSYLAKAWGIVLAAAMIGVFALGAGDFFVRIAVATGIVVNIEGLTMSMMLPRWKNDVKTLNAAWRLRKIMLSE